MNRDRSVKLATIGILGGVGVIALLGVGFLLYNQISERQKRIASLEGEVTSLRIRQVDLQHAKQWLDQWSGISLAPDRRGDLTRANYLYSELLRDLLYSHQLELVQQMSEPTTARSAGGGRNAKVFTPLNYQMHVEGTLSQLLGFLEDFHRLNIPHAIRDINVVNPTGTPGAKLDIIIKVEALSFANSPNRDFLPAIPDKNVVRLEVLSALKGCPTGLALAFAQFGPTGMYGNVANHPPGGTGKKPRDATFPDDARGLLAKSKLAGDANAMRDYRKLLMKNVFAYLVPPADNSKEPTQPDLLVLKQVKLTAIWEADEGAGYKVIKTHWRDLLQNRDFKLRAEPPLNELVIKDVNGHLLLGAKILVITGDLRTLILEHNGKCYAVHIGEKLGEALEPEKALSEDALKAYNIPSTRVADDKEP